jgi:hypothetical protein
VLFCLMCVICVLCLIVVPLLPSKKPFAVKINYNNKLSTGPHQQSRSWYRAAAGSIAKLLFFQDFYLFSN